MFYDVCAVLIFLVSNLTNWPIQCKSAVSSAGPSRKFFQCILNYLKNHQCHVPDSAGYPLNLLTISSSFFAQDRLFRSKVYKLNWFLYFSVSGSCSMFRNMVRKWPVNLVNMWQLSNWGPAQCHSCSITPYLRPVKTWNQTGLKPAKSVCELKWSWNKTLLTFLSVLLLWIQDSEAKFTYFSWWE